MTKFEFLNQIYKFRNETSIPDFPEDLKGVNFSIYLDMDLVPQEIKLENINPILLANALTEVKKIEEECWGTDSSNMREALELYKLKPSDYDWKQFNRLAEEYQHLARKEQHVPLNKTEQKQKDSLFSKMLACSVHFFTKRELKMLQTSSSVISIEDLDSIIALTLLKCLEVNDFNEEQIITNLTLTDEQCRKILEEKFQINVPIWYSSKKMLFNVVSDQQGYLPVFVTKNDVFYAIEVYENFYSVVGKVCKELKIPYKPYKTKGFNKNKNLSFCYYLNKAIGFELSKAYRKQLCAIVPFHQKEVPNEILYPVAILSAQEAEEAGFSSAYAQKMEKEINDAFGVTDETPESLTEEKLGQNNLFELISELPDGDILLFYCGVNKTPNGEWQSGKKKTFKLVTEKFNVSEYEAKKKMQACSRLFRKRYPNFLSDYVYA